MQLKHTHNCLFIIYRNYSTIIYYSMMIDILLSYLPLGKKGLLVLM